MSQPHGPNLTPTRQMGASSETTSDTAAKVAGSARALTQDAKHMAGEVADQLKRTASSRANSGMDRAVDELGGVATALRYAGDQLRNDEASPLATEYITKAADQVDRASMYFQSRTIGEVVRDVEGFARREPALFLGGAFVVGLVGGRFLKSSARSRAEESFEDDGQPGWGRLGEPIRRRASPPTPVPQRTAPPRPPMGTIDLGKSRLGTPGNGTTGNGDGHGTDR